MLLLIDVSYFFCDVVNEAPIEDNHASLTNQPFIHRKTFYQKNKLN